MMPRGYFSKGDRHPWQAGLFFFSYRGESEHWTSLEKLNKREIDAAKYRHDKRSTSIESESGAINQMYLLRSRLTRCLGIEFHLDHTIPISKGGTHTIGNLEVVPASWNESKSDRHCNRWIGVA